MDTELLIGYLDSDMEEEEEDNEEDEDIKDEDENNKDSKHLNTETGVCSHIVFIYLSCSIFTSIICLFIYWCPVLLELNMLSDTHWNNC